MSPRESQSTGPMAVIARRVKEQRTRKGWTAAQLGEAVTKEGVRWDRFAVANLENGKRQNISVVELLALSFVLDVPPNFMLIPDGGQPMRITPHLELYAPFVLEWLGGGDLSGVPLPPEPMVKAPGTARRWLEAASLLKLLQKYLGANSQLFGGLVEVDDQALSDFAGVVNEMVEKNVIPPPLPAGLVERMRAHGFRYSDQIQIATDAEASHGES